jgi:hypothetical protein
MMGSGSDQETAMHGNIVGFAVVAIVASVSAAAAAVCEKEILTSNMRVQKETNPEAAQKIGQGCTMWRGGDQNTGWKLLVEGYKLGQRNPLAALLIDDCLPAEAFGAACG